MKALADDVKVLVMDEPTARLSEAERQSLFRVVRELADRGVGLVFISHFLEEVREATDWLTVMRNGKAIASEPTKSLSVVQMAELMLGEKFKQTLDEEVASHHADDQQPVVLEAESVSCGPRLRDVTISLRAGEIMGVVGLVGSGRTRLCRVLSGAEKPTSGRLRLRGNQVAFTTPRRAIAHGVALIPEDRKHQGLSLSAPLAWNLCLMAMHRRLGRWGVVARGTVRSLSTRLVEDLEISPGNIDANAATLSGGNQQKVVLGKTFAADPDVLVIDQPTAACRHRHKSTDPPSAARARGQPAPPSSSSRTIWKSCTRSATASTSYGKDEPSGRAPRPTSPTRSLFGSSPQVRRSNAPDQLLALRYQRTMTR